MILLIDDVRDGNYDLIARTAEAGQGVLLHLAGYISELYIDHDLGSLSITGYNIVQEALENKYLPDKVIIVSLNPVGRKAIANLLLDNGFKQIVQGCTKTSMSLDGSRFERG